jgi:hypothetical protein
MLCIAVRVGVELQLCAGSYRVTDLVAVSRTDLVTKQSINSGCIFTERDVDWVRTQRLCAAYAHCRQALQLPQIVTSECTMHRIDTAPLHTSMEWGTPCVASIMLVTITVEGWCVLPVFFPSCHRRSSKLNIHKHTCQLSAATNFELARNAATGSPIQPATQET